MRIKVYYKACMGSYSKEWFIALTRSKHFLTGYSKKARGVAAHKSRTPASRKSSEVLFGAERS
jgi:hypothetical protein